MVLMPVIVNPVGTLNASTIQQMSAVQLDIGAAVTHPCALTLNSEDDSEDSNMSHEHRKQPR